VAGAVLVERQEDVGIQPRDELQYASLEVIHLRPVGNLDAIVLDDSLLELRERPLDLRAVVLLPAVPADGDPVSPDLDGIRHPGGRLFLRSRLGCKRREAVGLDLVS